MTLQQLMFACLMQLGYTTPLLGTTAKEHMLHNVAFTERIQGGETFFGGQISWHAHVERFHHTDGNILSKYALSRKLLEVEVSTLEWAILYGIVRSVK